MKPHRRLPLGMAGTALVAVLVAAASPLWAARIDRMNMAGATPTVSAPPPAAGWTMEPVVITDWRPEYGGAASNVLQSYRKGDRLVVLYLGYYRNQHRGAELLTTTNVMVRQKHPVWENVGESGRRENLGSGEVGVRETKLRSMRQRLLIWDWFRINGFDSTNRYVGKLLLARDRLLGRGDDAVEIIVATPYEVPDLVKGEDTLREFVRDMLPSVQSSIARAGAESVAARSEARQ